MIVVFLNCYVVVLTLRMAVWYGTSGENDKCFDA
jgi:hypothetical protein